MVYLYTMNYYSAIKKDEMLPLVTKWIDPEGIMLSEVSQGEKDKKQWFHSYVKLKQTNKKLKYWQQNTDPTEEED